MEQGFLNFFLNHMKYEPCILNGYKGTIVDSLYDKNELAILKVVAKNKDNDDSIVIHNMERFFPDVNPFIVQEVTVFYMQQKFFSLQNLLEYYKKNNEQEKVLFVEKWIIWKMDGAKSAYYRASCLWYWLNSKRFVNPKIFKEMFDTTNTQVTTAKMVLSVLKNIPSHKHQMFLMLCFKFITYTRPINISKDNNYNSFLETKKKNEKLSNVELFTHAANAYLLYRSYLNNNYSCIVIQRKKNPDNDELTQKQFIKSWFEWLKNYEDQSKICNFITYWEKIKETKKPKKNLCVWKLLIWETFIDNNKFVSKGISQEISIKKIKK